VGDVEEAGQVGGDDGIPLALFHLREELVAGDTGVVHQDVDRADFGGDLLDGRLALLIVGDVEAVQRDLEAFGLAGFNPRVLGGIAREEVADHADTRSSQRLADRGAETTNCASNESDTLRHLTFLCCTAKRKQN